MSDLLERNVRALLRRSYVPALPAPHYRDRLESLFLNEFERRFERRAPRPARWPRIAVALAAALLALLLGWRLFPRSAPGPATKESLLARGEVALGLPLEWRAADAEERTHGLQFASPSLTVATPPQAALDVLVSAGALHVLADSEVALARRADGDFAALRKGAAWFQSGERHTALTSGIELALRSEPAPSGASLAATDTHTNAREAPATEHAPAAPPAAPLAHALSGDVVDAESGAAIEHFTVGLLHERVGNETRPPVRRTFPETLALAGEPKGAPGSFRWADPPAGKYRVFVHAEGYALCALGEFELAGALPALHAALVRGASVAGLVLDASGAPLADALVISEQDSPTDGLFFADTERFFWLPIQTRTGPDGRFELAHLSPGRHTLRASAAEHAPSWIETSVPMRATAGAPAASAQDTDALTFTLGAGGSVTGTVTRDDGGPWAEAEIVVVAMDQAERARMNFALARTDAEGHYRVEHLPPITMIVVLIRADQRPDVRPVQLEEDRTVTADFGPPVHGIRLAGRVLRADGTPVAHQNIGLFERTHASWNQDWVASTTQPDGAFVFEGVQPGAYLIFLIDEMGRGLRCVDELELAPGAPELEHDVHVQEGGIAVTVRDARAGKETDAPLESAALILTRVQPDGSSLFSAFGLSDAHGRFDFVDLRAGTYRVTAYPGSAGLGFVESDALTLAADERTALALALEEGGAVDVLVRDAEGKPLERAVVTFTDERGHEHNFTRLPFTDGNGRYHANGLRPGRYRVAAQLAGFQGTPTAFRFELGRAPEIPVVLTPMLPR